ncbi:unnamed protein product [Didymodactylos carnosus]|uniref:TTF-type domain-containing protein n=1 Tax=Didymodactylos carnosus TaxID=1234261 RepID=A0A814XBA2_9BILA|nr:unnamed protein product [Didymodactylos carnosus]CAF3976521.1 unnamed protein product [Didymodactylos carnosus]
MLSNSVSACLLCHTEVLTKNFKRHYEIQHSLIQFDLKKYESVYSLFKAKAIGKETHKRTTTQRIDSFFQKAKKPRLESTIETTDECTNTNAQIQCENASSLSTGTSITLPSTIIISTQQLNDNDNLRFNDFQTMKSKAEYNTNSSIIGGKHDILDTCSSQPQSIADEQCESYHKDMTNKNDEIQFIVPNAEEGVTQRVLVGAKLKVLLDIDLVTLIGRSCDEYVSDEVFLTETREQLSDMKEKITKILEICDEQLQIIETSADIGYLRKRMVPLDPGIQSSRKYNRSELRYLVENGPYRPVVKVYPKDESMRKSTNRFTSKWYDEYTFLEYSDSTNAAYCFVCRLFGSGPGWEQGEDAWTKGGKKGKLDKHFNSKSHHASIQKYLNFKLIHNNVDMMLDKNLQEMEQNQIQQSMTNQTAITMLIDCARFLMRQNLAFRGDNDEDSNFFQIVNFLAKYNPVMAKWLQGRKNRPYKIHYMSNDSQNEFIKLLGGKVQVDNLNEIRKSIFYSVMADTTPDFSRKEMFSICIRYCSENLEPKERLISIKEVVTKTGSGLSKAIINELNDLELDCERLISQSYDYANNMSGRWNGVQAKLSEHLGRNIIYIPCQAHRSNTVIKHSCSSLEVAKLFSVLQSLYNYFTSSTKRLSLLNEKYKSNIFALIPKTTSTPRWSATFKSLKAVYESYVEILAALSDIVDDDGSYFDKESRSEADILLDNIKKFEFLSNLIFMKNVMANTNSLTTILQKQELDLITASEIMSVTVSLLKTMRNDDESLHNVIKLSEKISVKNGIDPDLEFSVKHRRRKPPRRIDDNPNTAHQFTRQSYCIKNYREVLDNLILGYSEVIKNIEGNVKSISKLLPSRLSSFDIKDAQIVSDMVRIKHHELLLSEIHILTKSESFTDNVTKVRDLATIINQSKQHYPNLFIAYSFLLSLPVTVASNERSFSRLKLIKNRLRSTMGDERLFHLILCPIERDTLDSQCVTELAKIWEKNKHRRMPLASFF